jgi:hypothetical protein
MLRWRHRWSIDAVSRRASARIPGRSGGLGGADGASGANEIDRRVQASFDRRGMMTTLGDKRPFAVMQATMTAVFGRPGISG